MPRFAPHQITGVIPALITPFDGDEAFDETRMRACVNFLIGRGVEGLYLTGSTGEAFLMSPEERKRVVEVVIDATAGRVPVMVHVGAIGSQVSAGLARHAAEAGADAVSSVPPFYYNFSHDQILDYYRRVTDASDLPMFAYNFPAAGVMGLDLIKKIAAIPGVAGIKYTAQTHFEIMRLKAEVGPQFLIYSGSDEMAMSGLSFGADGLIGSFYNLIPEVFLALRAAVASGDLATAHDRQATANAIIFFSLARNMFQVLKRGMAWQGADGGYCRSPIGGYVDANWEADLKAGFCALRAERSLTGVNFLDAL